MKTVGSAMSHPSRRARYSAIAANAASTLMLRCSWGRLPTSGRRPGLLRGAGRSCSRQASGRRRRWRPRSGVNEKTGVGSLQDRQVIEGKDPRPWQRVSPTERIRSHIDELFAQDKELPEILEDVARLGARLLLQAALEAEVTRSPRPRPLPAGGGLRRCSSRFPQWIPGYHRQEHCRARHPVPAEATRHDRGVRVPAVRRACHQDQRAGVAGDRLVRARPVRPRRRGHPR